MNLFFIWEWGKLFITWTGVAIFLNSTLLVIQERQERCLPLITVETLAMVTPSSPTSRMKYRGNYPILRSSACRNACHQDPRQILVIFGVVSSNTTAMFPMFLQLWPPHYAFSVCPSTSCACMKELWIYLYSFEAGYAISMLIGCFLIYFNLMVKI